ncbi:MAG TPA: hypothetical protein ENK16_01750 [Chromatiales bacterium]|nr:hypothetical protein [Chromatiales bacterium]
MSTAVSNSLPALTVVHHPIAGTSPVDARLYADTGAAAVRTTGDWMTLRTCLRQLWMGVGHPPALATGADEVYHADDAYAFVLEVITGLHSPIAGETNVLGQFRRAWNHFRTSAPAEAVQALTATVENLLKDTAAIRRDYLQGIGGASWGSLLRKLLRAQHSEHILLIGTGELARSIAPFFSAWPLRAWNHRPASNRLPKAEWIYAPEQARDAAHWADHVVLTTPPDPAHDLSWQQWLSHARLRSVTHLGHRRGNNAFRIDSIARCYDLDDVIELRDAQARLRSVQVERARRACHERAARQTFATPAARAIRA